MTTDSSRSTSFFGLDAYFGSTLCPSLRSAGGLTIDSFPADQSALNQYTVDVDPASSPTLPSMSVYNHKDASVLDSSSRYDDRSLLASRSATFTLVDEVYSCVHVRPEILIRIHDPHLDLNRRFGAIRFWRNLLHVTLITAVRICIRRDDSLLLRPSLGKSFWLMSSSTWR